MPLPRACHCFTLWVGSAQLFAWLVELCVPGLLPQLELWRPENEWKWKALSPGPAWPSLVDEPPADMQPAPRREMPLLALPGGGFMPSSGLGMCCRLSSVGEDARKSVLWYLLLGGRHLDTAAIYENAREVGLGIRQAIARGVPRSEIFLVTKTPPVGYEQTAQLVADELDKFGLDYIDLVLVHIPGNWGWALLAGCGTARQCRAGTWRALTEARAQGKIRAAGVSNFGPRQMEEMMQLQGAPLAVNQLLYHPWVLPEHVEAVDFCHRRGIAVTAYCSLGGVEDRKSTLAWESLRAIGGRHGKTPGQVLLRWAVQRNASVIPGTGNPKHMRENLDIYDFSLSEEDLSQIASAKEIGQRGGHRTERSDYVGIPDQQS